MKPGLYYEDFPVGARFTSSEVTVTADDIKRFAGEFDPQPFHLDEETAKGTFFGGLAGSGWHTAALTMRLVVKSLPVSWGAIGAGVDELKWPNALRPGDTIHIESEVLEARVLKSRPGTGLVRMRVTTLNQRGEPVQVMVPNMLVPVRA
jgi:acyl dehydratase